MISSLSNTGREMMVRIPVDSENYINLFRTLDEYVTIGKISTYGVSITTLDEVFLTVAREETEIHNGDELLEISTGTVAPNNNNSTPPAEPSTNGSTTTNHSPPSNVDQSLFFLHVKCLFSKRAINFKRDKKAWVCSTILPSFLTMIGFLLVSLRSNLGDMPFLELKLSDYNNDDSSNLDLTRRNPVPFGTSDHFACQPSKCITYSSEMDDDWPLYCGDAAMLESSVYDCWNLTDTSTDVAKYMNEDKDDKDGGVFTVDQDVSDIVEVRDDC